MLRRKMRVSHGSLKRAEDMMLRRKMIPAALKAMNEVTNKKNGVFSGWYVQSFRVYYIMKIFEFLYFYLLPDSKRDRRSLARCRSCSIRVFISFVVRVSCDTKRSYGKMLD